MRTAAKAIALTIAAATANAQTPSDALTCRGSGAPQVLIEPGAGQGPQDWATVMEALGRSGLTCAHDRAITADRERNAPATLESASEDLVALMESRPGRWVLIGHSLGGLVARRAAAQRPAKVEALVLVESAIDGAYRTGGPDPMCSSRARILLGEGTRRGDAVRARRELEWLCAAQRALEPVEGAHEGAKPPHTVVLMRTTRLDPAWRHGQREIAAALGTQVQAVEGAGHTIQADRPDVIVQTVAKVTRRAAKPQ